MLARVGAAAANALMLPFTLPYKLAGSASGSSADSERKPPSLEAPLAEVATLLLLVLTHHDPGQGGARNPFRAALDACQDTVHDGHTARTAATSTTSAGGKTPTESSGPAKGKEAEVGKGDGGRDSVDGAEVMRVPFGALFDTIGMCLVDDRSTLLLYSLVHGNPSFLEYVLVRTDLDALLLPLLQMLYNAPSRTANQIYMLLIVLLILSQDASFNANIHKLVLPAVPWYKERIVPNITLGSLLVVILIRTVKYNLSKLRVSAANTSDSAAGLGHYLCHRISASVSRALNPETLAP